MFYLRASGLPVVTAIAVSLGDALTARLLKPVHVARFPPGMKAQGEEPKMVGATGANRALSYAVGPENAVIARALQSLRWKVQHVGAWMLSFPFSIDGAMEAAEGTLMAQTFMAEPGNARVTFA
ncbi:hypothetical protein [Polaromonas sp. CG_9.11]|uniref:hypothetical protein n=1 Tax=Polaromonas sp. CG_9.11 TaxID=2787730 RepID=UPI0018CAB85D|nr:hypothetical protein [Polaromonas sp. CG_9.11]MBG6075566.1 branched-chain amino acid transport system substrate-binding protein [Polaromonas sp. CG_9.11]